MKRFISFIESENLLSEAMKRKRMVRDGKIVQKIKTTRPGTHRIEYDEYGNPREVRMTNQEILNRERGRKVGQRKADAKETQKVRKRENSMKIRRQSSELRHYNHKFPDVNSEEDGSI